jgi:hypothetical protein
VEKEICGRAIEKQRQLRLRTRGKIIADTKGKREGRKGETGRKGMGITRRERFDK